MLFHAMLYFHLSFFKRRKTPLSFQNQEEFITSTIDFLRQRNFDGIDLDFEYPGARGSGQDDKWRFAYLIRVRLLLKSNQSKCFITIYREFVLSRSIPLQHYK